ncbi:MAG: hypothetical protein NTW68_06255 [candidate division NC10 bacterium]|nr:hypothetical protein [candidate division NC10 bacterium]
MPIMLRPDLFQPEMENRQLTTGPACLLAGLSARGGSVVGFRLALSP